MHCIVLKYLTHTATATALTIRVGMQQMLATRASLKVPKTEHCSLETLHNILHSAHLSRVAVTWSPSAGLQEDGSKDDCQEACSQSTEMPCTRNSMRHHIVGGVQGCEKMQAMMGGLRAA